MIGCKNSKRQTPKERHPREKTNILKVILTNFKRFWKKIEKIEQQIIIKKWTKMKKTIRGSMRDHNI